MSVPQSTPVVLSLAHELTCERDEDQRLQLYLSRNKFADLAPVLDRARATVNQMDPIRVVFSVSDRVLVGVERRTGSTASQIAAGVVVGLILPDRSMYGHTGTISFFNNQVDPQIGTVSVFVDFPNPDRLLLPGSFVSVDVRNSQPEERAMVSVAAVQTDQSGHYVLTVTPDGTVHQQPVTLGRQIAQDFIVTKGLSAGDRVIVEGVQKCVPGRR